MRALGVRWRWRWRSPAPARSGAASGEAYAGPVSLRLDAETEPVILRVRAVAPIEIAVVDREGGKPIAGAEVELRSQLVWTAITGGDGVASFGGFGAHDPTIRVNAEGYAPVADRLINFGRRELCASRTGYPASFRKVSLIPPMRGI